MLSEAEASLTGPARGESAEPRTSNPRQPRRAPPLLRMLCTDIRCGHLEPTEACNGATLHLRRLDGSPGHPHPPRLLRGRPPQRRTRLVGGPPGRRRVHAVARHGRRLRRPHRGGSARTHAPAAETVGRRAGLRPRRDAASPRSGRTTPVRRRRSSGQRAASSSCRATPTAS